MEDKPREGDKLESILQQWGAQEALDEARTLELRPPRPGRVTRASLVKLRWGTLLCTILVVLGAAAAVLWWTIHWHKYGPANPSPTPPAQSQPAEGMGGPETP